MMAAPHSSLVGAWTARGKGWEFSPIEGGDCVEGRVVSAQVLVVRRVVLTP